MVLIDFWTYSCINCIRTIPHLNAWESEYGNNGLVIIGVHTPEFQFEKNYTNVLAAVHGFNITYAIAMDNNYSTWIAYNNHYWPADYIVDKNGDIRAEQFGEGGYDQTEQIIRELLLNASYAVPVQTTNVSMGVNFSGSARPRYTSAGRSSRQAGPTISVIPMAWSRTSPTPTRCRMSPRPTQAYLGGEWYSAPDSLVAENSSVPFLSYTRPRR